MQSEKAYRIPFVNPEKYYSPPTSVSSRELSNGKKVRELEDAVSKYLDGKYVVATNSGTTALYIMFRVFGLEGLGVAMPAFTWRSTAEAARMAGVTPFFFDIYTDTLCLKAEDFQSHGVSAICVNECFGCPAEYDRFAKLGLPILADGASSFGSKYLGKTNVDARIYSLSPTKSLTANEGGIIVCNEESLAGEMRGIRRWAGRMTEYNAACAINGLKRLPEVLEEKLAIAKEYEEVIHKLGLKTQTVPVNCISNRKDVPVFFQTQQERDSVRSHFEAAGIETRIYFTPAYEFLSSTSYKAVELPITERKFITGLCLPCYPGVNYNSVTATLEDAIECLAGKKRKTKSVTV